MNSSPLTLVDGLPQGHPHWQAFADARSPHPSGDCATVSGEESCSAATRSSAPQHESTAMEAEAGLPVASAAGLQQHEPGLVPHPSGPQASALPTPASNQPQSSAKIQSARLV